MAPAAVAAVAALLDMVALALGLWFALYGIAPAAAESAGLDPTLATVTAMGGSVGVILVAWACGSYRLALLRRFWRGATLVLALGLLLAVLGGTSVGGAAILAAFVLPARGLGALLATTALDFGLTERRAILYGGGERAERVMSDLAEAPDNDILVCALFDDRDDARSPPVVAGVPKLGGIETLVAFAREAEIEMVIITLPLSADARIRQILKAVEVLPLDVRLSDFSDDPTFRRRASGASGGGLLAVISRPMQGSELMVKRALDIVGTLVALVLLSPVLLLTALAIRLDSPGPIFFLQPRHGYNHRPIQFWKFRSMYAADCDPMARQIVRRGDSRVTRVGRFIRRWSIDELPQLFNVLCGDLSLVGPRPHALGAVSSRQEAFEAIVEGYAARHKVRPGITGWAQIHGWRGEIDDPEALRRRIEHDLHYIENWSIWIDLYVLAVTPLRLLDTRNAF